MKISVDDKELFSLTDIQKRVLCNEINDDIFDADMKRRLQWVLIHKYEECFRKLKEEWDVKLIANGVDTVPTNPDKYAELVFSQPNYKNRKDRDALIS